MYSNETKIYFAIIAGSLVLTAMLLAYIITFVKHQREIANSYLRQINIEISTLEKERERISSDLHDDLGPFLSSMKLQISLLRVTDPDDKIIISELTQHLNEIVAKIRETSENLMPTMLINLGLVRAIENTSMRINQLGRLCIHTCFIPESIKLPPAVEIHIFRIFQESINNAMKHSQASDYAVKLEALSTKLILIIEDNGIGFNYKEKLKNLGGIGLKNISARVDILKGTLITDNKLGRGAKYRIEIPL